MTIPAETSALGSQRSTYSVSWLGTGVLIIGALLVSGLCAAAIIYDRSVGGGMGTTILCGTVGLFPLLFAIFHISKLAQAAPIRVDVHDDGIVYHDGIRANTIAWNEIDTIWYSLVKVRMEHIPVRFSYDLKLRLTDGRTISIPAKMKFSEHLADVIATGMIRSRLPNALERIAKGEQLEFGKYRINRDELIADGNHIPWHKHPGMHLYNGSIILNAGGDVKLALKSNFTSNPMGKIPNVHMLVALVEILTAQAKQKSA